MIPNLKVLDLEVGLSQTSGDASIRHDFTVIPNVIFGQLRSLSFRSVRPDKQLMLTTFPNAFVAKHPYLIELETSLHGINGLEAMTPSTALKALSIRDIDEAPLNSRFGTMFGSLVILRLHITKSGLESSWFPIAMQSLHLKCLEIFQHAQVQPDGSVSETVGHMFPANMPRNVTEYRVHTTFVDDDTFDPHFPGYVAATLSTERLVSHFYQPLHYQSY